MASTPARSRGRTASKTPRRRGPVSAARKPSARTRGAASNADDLGPLLEEGLNLAEEALGKGRFAGLWGLAPTLVAAAGRYAKREPKTAAGLVLGLGGLMLVGRALMGSSDATTSSKSKSKRRSAPGARSRKSKPKTKPATS